MSSATAKKLAVNTVATGSSKALKVVGRRSPRHRHLYSLASPLRYISNHPLRVVSNLLLLLALALLLALLGERELSHPIPISEEAVQKVVQASRFTRDYRSDAVESIGSRAFLKVGGPRWAQAEGVRAVLHSAHQSGLSPEHQAVLLAIVELESGFNPMARASTSSACGLFQFIKSTGESFGLSRDDCMNPWLNAKAGVQHYLSNYERKVRDRVINLSGTERLFRTFELSYYLHRDGINSSNPDNDLKAIVLTGTQFLLRSHAILEQEQAPPPNFAAQAATRLLAALNSTAYALSSATF